MYNKNTVHTLDEVKGRYKATAKVDHVRLALRSMNSKLSDLREALDNSAAYYHTESDLWSAVLWFFDNYLRSLEHFNKDGVTAAIITQADLDHIQAILDLSLDMVQDSLEAEYRSEQAAERAASMAWSFPGSHGPQAGPGPEDQRERELEAIYWEELEAAQRIEAQGAKAARAAEGPNLLVDSKGRFIPSSRDPRPAQDPDLARRAAMTEIERLEEDFLGSLPEEDLAVGPECPHCGSHNTTPEPDGSDGTYHCYVCGGDDWPAYPGDHSYTAAQAAEAEAKRLADVLRARYRLDAGIIDPYKCEWIDGLKAISAAQAVAGGWGTAPALVWEEHPEYAWTWESLDLKTLKKNIAPGFKLEPYNNFIMSIIID